jgi:hypothetical protein
MPRLSLSAVVACLLLATACTSTSTKVTGTATPIPTPTPTITSGAVGPPVPEVKTTPLQTAQLADGATHLWPLAGAPAGVGAVKDLGRAALDGTVKGGKVISTTGPVAGTSGAQFTGAGFIATPVPAASVGMDRTFTIEFAFRSDNCSKHWSNALGTGAFVDGKRLGLNVLHYPRDFDSPCRMAFEFWNAGRYSTGCSTPQAIKVGTWEFYALTWDGTTATCWANGKNVGALKGAKWTSQKGTPFGIGGAGSGWGGALDSGSIADVALYPTVLAPAVLATHSRALAQV